MSGAVMEPIPFRRLLDEAVRHVRRHFRAMYLPVAVPLALWQGLMPIVQLRLLPGMYAGMRSTPGQPFDPAMFGSVLAIMGVALISAAVHGLGQGALVVGAAEAVAGREVSMRQAWATVLRPRVLGTLALAVLAMGGAMLFCLLPGIYVGLLFCLLLPVVVLEGLAGPAALGRSRELMTYNPRGDFGNAPVVKGFLIFFASWLITAAVGFVIQLPMMVLQQVYILRAAAEDRAADPQAMMASLVWIQVPSLVLNMLAGVVVGLYLSFAVVLFYLDLRARKEGTDLEQAVEAMAAARQPSPAPGV